MHHTPNTLVQIPLTNPLVLLNKSLNPPSIFNSLAISTIGRLPQIVATAHLRVLTLCTLGGDAGIGSVLFSLSFALFQVHQFDEGEVNISNVSPTFPGLMMTSNLLSQFCEDWSW